MDTRLGTGYDGSGEWTTTTAVNTDILAGKNKRYYKFSFNNGADCHIKVNGVRLFLKAGQGFETDYVDALVTSVVIEESGIGYNWIGGY
ncbi:hypothetical protein ABC255_08710 [Neobacillus sp. 3P2-tot-E-2]|uniref:hypothetical protein n=1 Tax=Neobacillus sp. 3P2-tot-E-2 TaxID=3132212 RepID=UPI00399F6B40